MKIGILLDNYDLLSNWELRIINEILKDNSASINLIIYNIGKINKLKDGFDYKITKDLLNAQKNIEKNIFKNTPTENKNKIINQLKKINHIELNLENCELINQEKIETINSYQLDVLINLGSGKTCNDILSSPKYGTWSLYYKNKPINQVYDLSLREIIEQDKSVKITLKRILNGRNEIIDQAFFNYSWSFFQSKNVIYESSVSLLLKNIHLLKKEKINTHLSIIKEVEEEKKKVSILDVLIYILFFYKKVLSLIIKRIKYSIFGYRYYCFTLFIGKGHFMDSELSKLSPVKLPKDEFWADPFIFNYKGEDYIFFENYEYSKSKGKISCAKIQDNKLINIIDVLDLDYHLSYPYIFEEDGCIYMMPETNENNRLEIYKCLDFPNKWELYSTAFDGEKIVDASFYIDDNNQRWLFLNKQASLNTRMDSELFIYKLDDIKFTNIQPHSQNPVIINSETARNGGAIFKYKNDIYRPSQLNIEGKYGKAININKIKKLSLDEYEEITIRKIYPDFYKEIIATHHIHQKEDRFVIDAAYLYK